MDIFDPMHVCNHTDQEGRYAYKVTFLQCYSVACINPVLVSAPARNDVSVLSNAIVLHAHCMNSLYSLRALLMALAPLVGAEAALGNKAVSVGWAKEAKKEKITEWSTKGAALVDGELRTLFQREYEAEYSEKMRRVSPLPGSVKSLELLCASSQRLGLRRAENKDDMDLIQPLFALLADHKLDFHLTFRHLTRFRPALLSSPDTFIDTLLRFTSTSDHMPQHEGASTRWKGWLEKYAARIENEKEEWVGASSDGDWQALREKDARLANPRFVLRQWVLEEVIAKVEADAQNGRCVLAKVMQVSSRSTCSVHQRLD
jgi:uncharacterized protein YdiU (UPF0061 family)